MKLPTEKQASSIIVDALADVLNTTTKAIRLQHVGASSEFDFHVTVPGHRLVIEYKMSAAAGPMAIATARLMRSLEADKHKSIPLVVVPYMGSVGQEICQRSGISWLDLSGNANIDAPGLKIRIEGRANKFVDRGRPPNVFAPKSSRITRQLLLYPRQFQMQADLARQTALGDGYVSRIVRRLQQEHYLEANDAGAVRPRDPSLLLDAWCDRYDFSRHRIIKGHVPARSGDELLQRVARTFTHRKAEYAATGLGAAWLHTDFAGFRLVTFYLVSMPPRSLLNEIDFVDEPKGANLWLVLPDDDGVFQGKQKLRGIECVSALQTYLDLKNQPERAKDAAVELRRRLLTWERHGK